MMSVTVFKCLLLLLSFPFAFLNHVIKLDELKWKISCISKNISVIATIPKSVHMALLENNIIEDPYVGRRDEQYAWIADEDWIFETTFYVPKELMDSSMIRITFDGVDTISIISLNGVIIGKTDNMFVKYSFMVRSYIKEQNILRIKFFSPTKYSTRKSKEYATSYGYEVPPVESPPAQHGRSHPNFIRKEQCSFSWDWGPSFPTIGIWKDVSLEFSSFAYLDDILIHVELDKSNQLWRIHLEAIVQARDYAKLIISYGILRYRGEKRFNANGKEKTYLGFFEVPQYAVELWWPRGYGNQTLYNAWVHLTDSVTMETTWKELKFGFRTVELVQEPILGSKGLSFFFKINELPIFMKGANWIPADSFQERVSSTVLEEFFNATVDANMNALRVWGGGVYEQDRFYELADELGVMIFQDLMFAVALYPVDHEFLSSVKEEIFSQIYRLQHHPSLIAWNGNNENEAAIAQSWWLQVKENRKLLENDYRVLYVETIKPMFESKDWTRPFVTSSPSNGISSEHSGFIDKNPQSPLYGDVHFYNYKDDCWNVSIFPNPRFASEYGYQSYPSYLTMSDVATKNDLEWDSSFMKYRQHHENGNEEIENFIKRHYKLPSSNSSHQYFSHMIYLSQIVQATCIKYESEHFRRLQGNIINSTGYTMGALYWQLNDIWQAPSWSSIEYGGRWKMLHYYAKDFFQPTAVTGYVHNRKLYVYVVTDHPANLPVFTLNIAAYNLSSFNSVWDYSALLSSSDKHAYKVYEAGTVEICPKEKCFLKLYLVDRDGRNVVSESDVFLSSFSTMPIKDPHLKISRISIVDKNNFKILLTAESPAAFVWLETKLSGTFSKNGFFMTTPKIEVYFRCKQRIEAQQLVSTLRVISLYDTYKG